MPTATMYNAYSPGYGYQNGTRVAGFSCDGQGCHQSIAHTSFYGSPDRSGWTMSRLGASFCPTCTPRYNPATPVAVPMPDGPFGTASRLIIYGSGELAEEPLKANVADVRFGRTGLTIRKTVKLSEHGVASYVFVPWQQIVRVRGFD